MDWTCLLKHFIKTFFFSYYLFKCTFHFFQVVNTVEKGRNLKHSYMSPYKSKSLFQHMKSIFFCRNINIVNLYSHSSKALIGLLNPQKRRLVIDNQFTVHKLYAWIFSFPFYILHLMTNRKLDALSKTLQFLFKSYISRNI